LINVAGPTAAAATTAAEEPEAVQDGVVPKLDGKWQMQLWREVGEFF
jgi:hypothetical protein